MRSAATMALACAALAFAAGCTPEVRVVRDDWDSFRAFAKNANTAFGTDKKQGQLTAKGKRPSFGIVLATFDGDDRDSRAKALADKLTKESQVPGVQVFSGTVKTLVYRGPYTDSYSDDAQRDLRQTKAMVVNNQRLFPDASLLPLDIASRDPSALSAELEKYELNQYAGFYTLQIGYYDENYGQDYRKAAEQAVLSLRADGEDAYFHHAPKLSMITIGIFDDHDIIRQKTEGEDGVVRYDFTYSPRVKEVQARFRNHLANGATIVQKRDGRVIGEQKTMLVRIGGE